MRNLILALALLALCAADLQAKKRRRRKSPALRSGQTCTLTRPVRVFSKTGRKRSTLREGVEITLLKVGKKWVTVRSDEETEGAVKLNRAFLRACKPTAAESAAPPATAAHPAPPPEPDLTPPPEISSDAGGEMDLPDSEAPRDESDAAGIEIPMPAEPEELEPFSALDVLGTGGVTVERRSRRRGTRDYLAYGGFAVAGVALITSGVLVGVSSGRARELAEDIRAYNNSAVRSSADADALTERKRGLAALDAGAIAAATVGVAAAGAGLFLLLTGDDTPGNAYVAPSAGDQGMALVLGGAF